MMRRLALRAAVVACAAAMLSACMGMGGPPKPADVKVTVRATADANPTADGRASSLVMRIYQLKADTKFMAADFFDLFEREAETLGAELVASQEISLAPGEQRELELEVAADAQLLGVVAAYRDIRNARWRVVGAAPTRGLANLVRKDAITIEAQRAAVTLAIRE